MGKSVVDTRPLAKVQWAFHRIDKPLDRVLEWRLSPSCEESIRNYAAEIRYLTHLPEAILRSIYGFPVIVDDTLGENMGELVCKDGERVTFEVTRYYLLPSLPNPQFIPPAIK